MSSISDYIEGDFGLQGSGTSTTMAAGRAAAPPAGSNVDGLDNRVVSNLNISKMHTSISKHVRPEEDNESIGNRGQACSSSNNWDWNACHR